MQHLPQPEGIPAQVRGHVRRGTLSQGEPPLLALGIVQAQAFAQDRGELEVLLLQRQMARLRLGEIQEIVDRGEELLGPALDEIHI